MAIAAFIEESPEFEIKRGVVCVRAKAADQIICIHMAMHDFRISLERAKSLLANYDASGEVVPFPEH